MGILLPPDMRLVTRVLIGRNAGLWLYFVLVGVMITTTSKESMMRRAAQQDDGRFAILILATPAAIAAFGGIFARGVSPSSTACSRSSSTARCWR
jgi:uncharacterized membrane protein